MSQPDKKHLTTNNHRQTQTTTDN